MRDRETSDDLAADNRRLRQLLDKRHLPSELRHRLRGTLALLRAIIQQGQHTSADVEQYAGHLLDRLDAIAWAQSAADDRGSVDLHTLIAERLRHFNVHESPLVQLIGPEIDLSPRAGQYFALAVQELTTNAIEHGRLGSSGGELTVAWGLSALADTAQFQFVWTERGLLEEVVAGKPGIGSLTLLNMLRFEFGATTNMTPSADSFRCEIVFPWQERFGALHSENLLSDSTFSDKTTG